MCATLFTPHLSALTQIRVERRRRWQTHTRGGAGRTAWWWRWTAACSQICGPSHGPFLEGRTRKSCHGPEKKIHTLLQTLTISTSSCNVEDIPPGPILRRRLLLFPLKKSIMTVTWLMENHEPDFIFDLLPQRLSSENRFMEC